MEWVLRILMSYLTVPSQLARTDAEPRKLLRAMILPAVLANAPADPDSNINHRQESRNGLTVGAPLQSYRRSVDGGRRRIAPLDGELTVLLV